MNNLDCPDGVKEAPEVYNKLVMDYNTEFLCPEAERFSEGKRKSDECEER